MRMGKKKKEGEDVNAEETESVEETDEESVDCFDTGCDDEWEVDDGGEGEDSDAVVEQGDLDTVERFAFRVDTSRPNHPQFGGDMFKDLAGSEAKGEGEAEQALRSTAERLGCFCPLQTQ
jgi:hypothetical protein